MEHSKLHLITEDGVTEILVDMFTDDEWKALLDDDYEPEDPKPEGLEPEGLELYHPDYLVDEN